MSGRSGRAPPRLGKALTRLDRVPWLPLGVAALTLGLAPFQPEPHLLQKLRWLMQGELVRPLDVFDLVMHATPWALLALKLLARRYRPG
jgi:hypothetical protein